MVESGTLTFCGFPDSRNHRFRGLKKWEKTTSSLIRSCSASRKNVRVMNIGFLSLPKFSKTPGSGPKKTRKNNIVPDTVVVRLLKKCSSHEYWLYVASRILENTGFGTLQNKKNNIVPDTAVFKLPKHVRVMNTDFLSLPKVLKTPVQIL